MHDRHRAAAGGLHDRRALAAREDHLGHRQRLQVAIWCQRGDVDAAFAGAAIDRRRRVRDRRAGAALHRAQRHDRGRRARGRRHGLGLDAVPVLRPQGAGAALRPAGRQDPRRSDGDRRRLRRQGRVPVDDRRPRGAAGVEVGPAGEDDLRPRRGHGGDDQAASVAHAASHGGRRATAGCSRWTSTS